MRRALPGLALLFALTEAPAEGFTASRYEEHHAYWRRNIFRRVLSDQKFLFTTWAPGEARQPLAYLPLAAVAAPGLDRSLSDTIAGWGRTHGHGAARAFTKLGDGTTGIALVGGTYLISRLAGNTRMARASSLSAESLVNAAIWSSALKHLTRRARPGSAESGGEFLVSDPAAEPTSFPSGHATGAFAVATVLAGEYREKRWVPWVAYGTAGLIGTSRVALERHYLGDVIVGGFLGHSLGRMVLARERGEDRGRVRESFEPVFQPQGQRYGLGYRRSW